VLFLASYLPLIHHLQDSGEGKSCCRFIIQQAGPAQRERTIIDDENNAYITT